MHHAMTLEVGELLSLFRVDNEARLVGVLKQYGDYLRDLAENVDGGADSYWATAENSVHRLGVYFPEPSAPQQGWR